MTPTDFSEMGLEVLITADLTGLTSQQVRQAQAEGAIAESPMVFDSDWTLGNPHDFDRQHAIDPKQLFDFLNVTQPQKVAEFGIDRPGPTQNKFLDRLQGEIAKNGVVEVLRKGVKDGPATFDLYYWLPTEGNPTAQRLFNANIFSVTRQLRYSLDETARALDLAIFINGLPFATFELKNSITKQTVADAMLQYKRDRGPKERLFQHGVCAVHFALDDNEITFTTKLDGFRTWFLPFNKGYNDGAGNPPNPNGIKTDYLWKQVLERRGLAGIIENFVQFVEKRSDKGVKSRELIFPRFHQLDVVRKLLADAAANGVGRKYLIQHSAGSGKSYSIAWLAHQLIELKQGNESLFDTVLIVTDRRALDSQLGATVKAMAAQTWTAKRAESSSDLSEMIRKGQRIISTTVQKFPIIVNSIGDEHRYRNFAIIIDEAHGSQGGGAAGKMNATLAGKVTEIEVEAPDFEDKINEVIEGKRMLGNASYFAFTATPKNRTLELFGERYLEAGETKFRPFHSYTMKQAIQEEFILDVLQNYTPYKSFYKLVKTVEDDPEFDSKRAQTKLRRYVESDPRTITQKARIIVEHFHTQVIQTGKIGGEARAIVATGGVSRAIEYWKALKVEYRERKSPYQPIIAFAGEHLVSGKLETEASLNGFPGIQIPDRLKEHPYRFLVVAEKYLTGFDEPLLHTMYVDKPLNSIKAVQTLSRLNRAHPKKTDTMVLDFFNDPDTIVQSFEPYYRTTLLSGETDPNKLHDLKDSLDKAGVYTWEAVVFWVDRFLAGADRVELEPVLDACRDYYVHELDEERQIEFKGNAKAFVRTYNFLSAVLPYGNPDWERLANFLKFLTPKLPAPDDPDLTRGILDVIDLDSYRIEALQKLKLSLADAEGELSPVPDGVGGFEQELEVDRLSSILQTFNDLFADAGFTEDDRVRAMRNIEGPIMSALLENPLLASTLHNNDLQNTLLKFKDEFQRALVANISNNTQVYTKQQQDATFAQQLESMVFELYKNRMTHR